jgi:WD40 repeat protein
VAALGGKRVVTGGFDGCVLMWDLTRPRDAPVKLGEHDDSVLAVAELAGRVVSGGEDGRVLVWEPAGRSGNVIQLRCSVTTLATRTSGSAGAHLIIAHQGGGFTMWQFASDPDAAGSSRGARRLPRFGWLRR